MDMKIQFNVSDDDDDYISEIGVLAKDQKEEVMGTLTGYIFRSISFDLFDSISNGAMVIYEEIRNKDGKLNSNLRKMIDRGIKKIAIIDTLNVNPEFRGNKIGMKLVSSFVDKYCQNLITLVLPRCDEDEEKTKTLPMYYKKQGFKMFPKKETMYLIPESWK